MMRAMFGSRRLTAAALAAVVLATLSMCSGRSDSTTSRQDQVEARGAAVMPFDQKRTTHVFRATVTGGLQRVVAKHADDSEQVTLARRHLRKEASRFRAGDFTDPMAIHGMKMPGLDALRRGAARVQGRLHGDPARRADLVHDGGPRAHRSSPRLVRRAAHGPRRQRPRLTRRRPDSVAACAANGPDVRSGSSPRSRSAARPRRIPGGRAVRRDSAATTRSATPAVGSATTCGRHRDRWARRPGSAADRPRTGQHLGVGPLVVHIICWSRRIGSSQNFSIWSTELERDESHERLRSIPRSGVRRTTQPRRPERHDVAEEPLAGRRFAHPSDDPPWFMSRHLESVRSASPARRHRQPPDSRRFGRSRTGRRRSRRT